MIAATANEQTAVAADTNVGSNEAPEQDIETPVINQPATGCDAVRAEASKYAWDVETVVRIAKAESGCNTYAIGDNYVIGGIYAPSCGVGQIRTLPGRPTCEELQHLPTNIAWMWKISNGGTNFRPWSVYISGKYLAV